MIGVEPTGKGATLILVGLLLASGAVRLSTDANIALASGTEGDPVIETVETACVCDGTPAELTAALLARETRVTEQETRLEDRLRALAIAEEEMAARLTELQEAEASLEAAIATAETASSGDLDRLTAVYENMKPAQAAALFEEMSPNFAAGFVGQMRPDAAAAIMAGLEPTTAYAISVILAGRNAEVPTE